MNEVENIISQLEQQRSSIDRAISALREISQTVAPKNQPSKRHGAKKAHKKRRISPEGRQRIAEAARRRWAEVKKAQAATKTPTKKKAQPPAAKKRSTAKKAAKKAAKKVAGVPAEVTA